MHVPELNKIGLQARGLFVVHAPVHISILKTINESINNH